MLLKMTIVYPLATQLDYTELKYSLRSVEKYLPPPYEIVLVGDTIPEWITNVTQVQLPDVRGRKQLSIKSKILAALGLCKEILFLNDDVYLLEEAKEFPYYFYSELKTYPEPGARPLYEELLKMGKPLKNFDGHFPLIYERDKFTEAINSFSADCIIKSAYCNYLEIEGTYLPDCKLMTVKNSDSVRQFIKGRPCFSTGIYSLEKVVPVLEELFPNKSKFEIF